MVQLFCVYSLFAQENAVISDTVTRATMTDSTEFIIDCVCPSTSPLFLVDELEVSSDVLARLNPDDIQNFSIIKDAKAIEMYGTRATNGVVVITTKLSKKDLNKMIKRAKKNNNKR